MFNFTNSMMDQPEDNKQKSFRIPPILGFIWAIIPILYIFTYTLNMEIDEATFGLGSGSIIKNSVLQILSIFIMLVVPALVISAFYKRPVSKFLHFDKLPSLKLALLTIGIILSGNLFLNYLIDLNALIPLPEHLAEKFRALQEITNSEQQAFLDFQNFPEFLMVFLTIAIVPALAEELYFRGLLVGILFKMKLQPFHVVFISSILFSMMHFQFYYFLALLFMGAVLGYIYYRTKNLWYSILAHFINNGLLVVLTTTNKLSYTQIDLEASPSIYVSIAGFCTFALLIFIFHQNTEKTKF